MYKALMLAVVTLSMTLGCSNKAKDHTCPVGCTKPCCVDSAAKADKPHTCPPDCTKPCCADKAEAAHTCPADCTKPCCADKAKTE